MAIKVVTLACVLVLLLATAHAGTASTKAADAVNYQNRLRCGGPTAVVIFHNGESCCCSADRRTVLCNTGLAREYAGAVHGLPCCCLTASSRKLTAVAVVMNKAV